MFYRWLVRFLKTDSGDWVWRRLQTKRGRRVADNQCLPEYIRRYAPGHSFADIGTMWGVNGEYAFLAEEVGASSVKAVDVFGPTPEFEAKRQARDSSVEFILGDAGHPDIIAHVGMVDVVFCAGVLYHHPSPFDLLVALRRMCRHTLILRTFTIPEIPGLPHAAVYYPMLNAKQRKMWDLSPLGITPQVGITDGFEPREGYGNWFWGMTPSCLESLLATAGFRVELRTTEPFRETYVCSVDDIPFAHRLPDELDSASTEA